MTSTDFQDVELIIQVPEEHACYVDHFPGDPLVPGALLLKWIMAAIEKKLQCKLIYIKQIKFLAAVKPADQLRVLVNVNRLNLNYSISVSVGETSVIKGILQAANANGAESAND